MSSWPQQSLVSWSEQWSCMLELCLRLLKDMNPLWCHAGSAAVITLCHNCSVSCMQSLFWLMLKQFTSTQRKYFTVQYHAVTACLESRETIDFSFGYLYFTKENLFAWSCFKYKELTSASRSLYARAQQAWGEGAKYPSPDPDMQDQHGSVVVIFYSLHPWLG